MTLTDAAAYLRIAESDVLRIVREQGLPGRKIGSQWRFLKSALNHWLGAAPAKSNKEALLAMTGAFKNDPYLDDIVREAYRKRFDEKDKPFRAGRNYA
jgi:excisionase family DNA binding protein